MKIIITRNKTIYGVLLGTYHSVITDGETVWSYESLTPFSKRTLKAYKYVDYEKKIGIIYKEIDIPDIKISHQKLPDYYLCYDWVGHQLMMNQVEVPITFTTDNLKEKAYMSLRRFWYISILFIIIPLIVGFIGLQIGEPNTLQQCGEIFNYDITIE